MDWCRGSESESVDEGGRRTGMDSKGGCITPLGVDIIQLENQLKNGSMSSHSSFVSSAVNSPKEGLIDQENTSKVRFLEAEDKVSSTERLPDIFTQPL